MSRAVRFAADRDLLDAAGHFIGEVPVTRRGRINWSRSTVWKELWDIQGGICCWCDLAMQTRGPMQSGETLPPDRATIEHRVALVDGGRDHRDNLQLAHNACNQKFSDKNPNRVKP